MTFSFTDFASTTVAGGSGGVGTPLNPTDTTLYVPTGQGALFPSSGAFMLLIGTTGIAKCTSRSSDTLTIVRGTSLTAPDGPTAADPIWPLGTTVQLVLTAGELTAPSFAGAVTAPGFMTNLGPGAGLGIVAAGDVLDTDASQNVYIKAPSIVNFQIPNGTTVLSARASGGNGMITTRLGGGSPLGIAFQVYDGSSTFTPFSLGGQINNATSFIDKNGNYIGLLAPTTSSSAPATASSGTIATAGLAVSRVSPAGAVTGVILQAGTVTGQMVTVINEAVAANSVTFNATPATSHVASGAEVIAGVTAAQFVYDGSTSLWYRKK